ncbi:hypothetical protein BGX38DRAFT_1051221, partial [Terfezia claveryi]
VYPWFTGIAKDHKTLDMPGVDTWSQLSSYYRDFARPHLQASERTASIYGGQVDVRLPKLGLSTTCTISNVLVGRCRWDGIPINKELHILFGSNDVKAREWV